MRSRRTGKLYLAGLVIAAAVLHCATVIVLTVLMWGHRGGLLLVFNLLFFGVIPAVLAIARASRKAERGSVAWSGAGLVILLGAMVFSPVRGAF